MHYNDLARISEIKFKSLVDYLYKSKESQENKPVFISQEKPFTYAAFVTRIEENAKALIASGIHTGNTVALMLPNVPEFCILYYALLLLGVRIIPINIMFNPRDLHFVLEDSQAEAIIAWDKFAEHVIQASHGLQSCKRKIFLNESQTPGGLTLKGAHASSSPSLASFPTLKKDDDALIFYTAGMVDRPKGAIFTHQSLSIAVRSIWETLLISESDIVLAVLPLFHPFAQMATLNAPIAAGSTIILLAKLDIDEILRSIEEYQVTCLIAVPSVFDEITRRPETNQHLKSLRMCLAAGAPLNDETYDFFQKKYHLTILEGYSLTECLPLISCSRIYRQRRRGSVGLPLPDIEAAIFDEQKEQRHPGETGEIAIRSQALMRGYINRDAATHLRTNDGWYFTGDFGKMDLDGYLYLLDRKSEVIIKDGFYISPTELEKILNSHEKVQLTAVLGVCEKKHGEIIKAFVMPKPDVTLNVQELKDFYQNKLPPYKFPDSIDIVDHLPRTTTGKVLKRELRKRLNASQESIS
jgi:long-chain acyl-CoA synthetase